MRGLHDIARRSMLRRQADRFRRSRSRDKTNRSAARARTWPRWRRSACRCPRASRSRPRYACAYYARWRRLSPTACTDRSPTACAYRRRDRQEVWRSRRSAAGLGPLGRAGVDAGDDGHRAEPRASTTRPSKASPLHRATRASRGTAIAASSRCIPTWCWASITMRSRMRWKSPRKTSGYLPRYRDGRRDWQTLVARI